MSVVQIPEGYEFDIDSRLPEGTFLCEVGNVSQMSSSKGTPMLVMKLVCVEDSDEKDKVAFDYPPVSETSLWRLRAYGIASGCLNPDDKDSSKWQPGGEIDTDDLLGARLYATIAPEEYQGQTRLRVTQVEPAPA